MKKIVFKGTDVSVNEGNEFSFVIKTDNNQLFCLKSKLDKNFIDYLISINKLEVKEIKEVKEDINETDDIFNKKIDDIIETLKNLNKEILYFNERLKDINEEE